MAVKREGVQPPPVYRSGGRVEHYSIEVLRAERQLILGRIKQARAEKGFYKSTIRKARIEQWLALAEKLRIGIHLLKTKVDAARLNPEKTATPAAPGPLAASAAGGVAVLAAAAAALAGPPKAIERCKHFAKCGEFSYWYCFSRCEKRKNKTCNLVRKYTRGKK